MGKMWLIDHTRVFLIWNKLWEPQVLIRCERTLLDTMRALTREMLAEAMGKIATKEEIDTLLTRRDLIVQLFDQQIAARGEAAVLYDLQ